MDESGPRDSVVPPPSTLPSRLKTRLIRSLYWLLRHVPFWLFGLAVKLLVSCGRLLYWLPGSPVRRVAHDACTIAARAGYQHDPATVYRQLTDQVGMALTGFFAVYRQGVEPNLWRVELDPKLLADVRRCLEEHHGVVLAAPHQPGGVLSSFRLGHEVPTLVVTRQDSRDAAKAAMHRDIFGHLGLETLMARGATPRQVLRTCVDGVRADKVVVFSVDNIHRGRRGVSHQQAFGEDVRMGTWAARITRHAGVPLLPVWVGRCGDAFLAEGGEPVLVTDLDQGVQHYLRFFEKKILADPGSWLHLLDRKWRRVLSAAARRTTAGHPGGAQRSRGVALRRG